MRMQSRPPGPAARTALRSVCSLRRGAPGSGTRSRRGRSGGKDPGCGRPRCPGVRGPAAVPRRAARRQERRRTGTTRIPSRKAPARAPDRRSRRRAPGSSSFPWACRSRSWRRAPRRRRAAGLPARRAPTPGSTAPAATTGPAQGTNDGASSVGAWLGERGLSGPDRVERRRSRATWLRPCHKANAGRNSPRSRRRPDLSRFFRGAAEKTSWPRPPGRGPWRPRGTTGRPFAAGPDGRRPFRPPRSRAWS